MMDGKDERRLPWRREPSGERFVAHPDGIEGHVAWLRRNDTKPEMFRWEWGISWTNRFEACGSKPTKQEAANEATSRWWRFVKTVPEPPAGGLSSVQSLQPDHDDRGHGEAPG